MCIYIYKYILYTIHQGRLIEFDDVMNVYKGRPWRDR